MALECLSLEGLQLLQSDLKGFSGAEDALGMPELGSQGQAGLTNICRAHFSQ